MHKVYVKILPTTVDPIVVGQGVNGAVARGFCRNII